MNQRGATIVESMVCLLLLCLVLFSLLQIFQWITAKMVCEYSSFYAAKGRAYGFADTIVTNGARVAAIAASGKDTGSDKEPLQDTYRGANGNINIVDYRQKLAERAQNYMVHSDLSINYEYWPDGQTTGGTTATPALYVDTTSGDAVTASVGITNMPLMDKGVAMFVNGTKTVDIPAGKSDMYNHSKLYLENQ
ncbi:MAG: hypothetical protein WCI51_00005 [Lentisphaerota bacterium]